MAAYKRTKAKALGVDLLSKAHLETAIEDDAIRLKILNSFNEWLQSGSLPQYVKQTRIVALSKEANNEYPQVGAVRTLAVACTISKVYERLIQDRLTAELAKTSGLDQNQFGFQQNKSTLNAVDQLLKFLEQARARATTDRQRKTPTTFRTKSFVCCLDYSKAFDVVPRQLMIQAMENKALPSELTHAMADLLTGTQCVADGKVINTSRGTPQGSIYSPFMYTLTQDTCLKRLTEAGLTHISFADDQLIAAHGERELFRSLNIIDEWCAESTLKINKSKSILLVARKDKRTRPIDRAAIRDIPVAADAVYLGITIDDCLSLK
eukprot:gene86-180_t